MTDPQNTATTPNPQDLIDQALGSPTPTPTPTPTLPTPEPLSQPAEEMSEPTPTPTLPVEPATETPATVANAEAMPADLTQSVNDLPPLPETPAKAAAGGEEMPLAFAGNTEDTPPAPTMNAPVVENVAPVVPPILTAPLPTPETGKKKGVMSKIMAALIAVVAFAGVTTFAGYWAYIEYGTVNPVKIAGVQHDNEDSCNGCTCDTEGCGGGWKRWDKKTQSCKVTGICNSGKPDKDTDNPMEETEKPATGCNSANANTCCGDGYLYCGGDIKKCVINSALEGKGCNGYGLEVYGIPIVYGANPGKFECDPKKVASGLQTQCGPSECGGTETYCFDRRGSCNSTVIPRGDGSIKVDTGFCGLVGQIENGQFKEYDNLFCTKLEAASGIDGCENEGDLKYNYTCDINGCSTTDAACKIYRYTCDGTKTGASCLDNEKDMGGAARFAGKCGTVEQIDVTCGGYKMSRTRINPECIEGEEIVDNPKHYECNTTTYQCQQVDGAGQDQCSTDADCVNPTLMCTGLSRTPTTTPVVGDTLTFTCQGSDTPAGSTRLTYEYRYQINGGAWQSMITDKSLTPKGTLTIAACGSYKVQCRACGTVKGSQVCDPVWSGATAQ